MLQCLNYRKAHCRHQFESFFPELNIGAAMADMVFSVLDGDHNGYLDFKEFQQAIDLVWRRTNQMLLLTELYWKVGARLPDDRLRWSFKLYDEDNSGSIALDEMEKVGCNLLHLIGTSICH